MMNLRRICAYVSHVWLKVGGVSIKYQVIWDFLLHYRISKCDSSILKSTHVGIYLIASLFNSLLHNLNHFSSLSSLHFDCHLSFGHVLMTPNLYFFPSLFVLLINTTNMSNINLLASLLTLSMCEDFLVFFSFSIISTLFVVFFSSFSQDVIFVSHML